MNDTLISITAYLLLTIAFVSEGFSHGWRWKESSIFMLKGNKSLTRAWHIANSVFIACLTLGLYFLQLGSDYSYQYKFDMYFLYDIGFTVVYVAALRWIIFGPVCNVARGVTVDYVGYTSTGDILYRKYMMRFFPPIFLLFVRSFIYVALFLNIIGLI